MSFGPEFGPAERLRAQQVTPEIQTDGLAPVDRHQRKYVVPFGLRQAEVLGCFQEGRTLYLHSCI